MLLAIYTYLLSIVPHIQRLSPVNDFIDGIEDKVKEYFIECIKSNFETILSLLNSGLDSSSADGIGGIVSTYLTSTPASVDSTLWTNIKNISEASVVPIAVTIVTIVSVYDLIQMVISGNNMRDFDTAIFFKWIFKTMVAITLCSNVFVIVSEVFKLGADVSSSAYNTLGINLTGSTEDVGTILTTALKGYGMGWLALINILSLVVMFAVYAMFAIIMVVLCSRMIEAVMYMSVAPISMATMMQSEWRQIGNSWLRGLIAIAFQGFFVIIALAFLGSMFSSVIGTITSTSTVSSIIWSMLKLIGYSLALIFTILRTEKISKTMFAAH